MRRNCNLELQLLPPAFYSKNKNIDEDSSSSGFTDSIDRSQDSQQKRRTVMEEESSKQTISQQPLTIFYNGKICVCDVSEFQAKAILLLANRESDERLKTPTTATANLRSPMYSPTASLSMKKSLQRFLQKRKHRAQAMTPYNHR